MAVKPKQTRGLKFHWIFDAESMRLLLASRQCPPDLDPIPTRPVNRGFHCQFVYMPTPPHTLCRTLSRCRTVSHSCLVASPGPRLACPPGSADGVIYCYQTLEHIKHFITCQSAASNNSPAGPARQQTKRRQGAEGEREKMIMPYVKSRRHERARRQR